MANLFQRPRSPFWWVSYTTPAGRTRVSTGIRHDGRKSPPKDSTVWELRRTIEERQARAKFGAAPMVEPKLVRLFMDEYLANLQGVRPASVARYQFMVQSLNRWLATESVTLVSEVNYPVASRYVAHRRGAGIGPGTLRGEVRLFNKAWAEARKLHLCEFAENPWTFTFKQDREEEQPFTDAELAAILAQKMPVWLRLSVDIALYTGARSSSIKGLRWEDIGADVIHFRTSKTTAFTLPLHPRLAERLAPHRQPSGTVLPDDVLSKCAAYFSQMFKFVCQRAKVPRGHFHLFRHTFISRLAQAGVEQRVTQLLANHASADVHRHYTHSNAALLAPQLGRLTYGECANGAPEVAVSVSNP